MKFSITQEIFSLYPKLQVGLLHCTNIINTETYPELALELRRAEQEATAKLAGQDLKQHPAISVWQEAHRAFGNNPNKNQPSIQALLKRVLAGKNLPSINSLVDCYNVVSLRHLLPAGGEDLDACKGDIMLCRAQGGEHFIELGSSNADPAVAGEVIYKDAEGVLCRRFNWREADRTKITNNTKNAILVIESLVDGKILASALEELSALVGNYCKASCKVFVLDNDNREAVFSI